MIVFFLAASLCAQTTVAQHRVENNRYLINLSSSKIEVVEKGTAVHRTLLPALTVGVQQGNLLLGYQNATNGLTPQASWKKDSTAKGESDLFKTVRFITLRARGMQALPGNVVRYTFPEQPAFSITLQLSLPAGNEDPVLQWQLTAKRKAWFTAAFSGITPVDTASLSFLYQPLVWSWKRFPDKAYLTPESYATTAAVFTNNGKATEALAPDTSEIPYRFAHLHNSRFGLLLRNEAGQAQPMVFAPLPGAAGSLLQAGQTYRFKTRYVLKGGDWNAGMQHLLRNTLGYRNERKNATATLNQTLDNIISFAMNDTYGGWVDSLKGFAYDQDAVGTVKVVSALHQLGAALVTGNRQLYRQRALPTMAYLLSREKYLFSTNEAQKSQSPGYTLNGPSADVGELSGLYQMTNGNTFAFRSELDRIFGKKRKLNLNTETGGSWQDYLHRYRVNNDSNDLIAAVAGAKEYLHHWETAPNTFNNDPGLRDKEAAFLTDFAPKLYDLMELYEETQHPPFLETALQAARQMVLWTRSNPLAPDSLITVNKGGKVKGFIGKRYKLNSYDFLPGLNDTTYIPEETVGAWQTSLVGLPPEQPGTYMYGPIMLTQHPAWFLKLAQWSGDTLLRDAAYNAVMGRYAGFPGYYFTSLHTNVYQKAGYALKPFMDIRYNAVFYNHVFPHITLLIDFLVSDASYRSKGKVDFPGVFAPGYAYLSSKVYGNRRGTVFGNKDVRLWLPPDALHSSSVAFNHLLGVGGRDLYVVLMNTEQRPLLETIRLNQDVIPWVPGRKYEVTVYHADGDTTAAMVTDGLLQVSVPAGGLVACKIAGLKVEVQLPEPAAPSSVRHSRSFVRDTSDGAFGTVTGMLLNTFSQFSDAYIFTSKGKKDFKTVSLEYRLNGGAWQAIEDHSFPFEFDVHLEQPHALLEYRLAGTGHNGDKHTSSTYQLTNQ